MICTCYSAHGARHRCRDHLEYSIAEEDFWVPAGECRTCIALDIEKAEHDLEMLRERFRNGTHPRSLPQPSHEEIQGWVREHNRRLDGLGF